MWIKYPSQRHLPELQLHLVVAPIPNRVILKILVYYQIDHYRANSQLPVEYILTAYNDDNNQQYYYVIYAYDSDVLGLAELYYFSRGDGGANATIGA